MRTKPDEQGKSVRLLRVGEQMRHVLADLLSRGEVRDDVLASHIVSVSEVRVSPDLRHATAFVKPLLAKDEEAVLTALRRNTKFIRAEMARRVNTKYAPDLKFQLDNSFEEAGKIDAILRSKKVRRDVEARDAGEDGDAATSGARQP